MYDTGVLNAKGYKRPYHFSNYLFKNSLKNHGVGVLQKQASLHIRDVSLYVSQLG